MRRIYRVNVRTGQVTSEQASDELNRICGRQFIAHTLNHEVEPTCEALGRHNKFIISQGWFSDTYLSTAGKISIGGKSPLTGGIKEANTGGYFGRRLSRLGVKAVILEDLPDNREIPRVLCINSQGATLQEAPELKLLPVSETIRALRTRFGTNIGILCLGPAGERLMYGAGVACPDDHDVQIRYAARGGLGALLGSKGIKAIVVQVDKPVPAEVADAELLKVTVKEVANLLAADPKSRNRNLYGTLDIMEMANFLGLLPTRNFSEGYFAPAEEMTGPKFHSLVDERGGEGRTGTPCVPGCTIQCSNVLVDKSGEKIVASLQYESLSLLGPNLGIADIDEIGKLTHLCNEMGVDTIETGAAIGVAMEAGVVPFGDAEGAKDLVRQIGQGTPLGRILGNGANFTGQAYGIRRVPASKGQAMPAYDPRALKGNGVLYETSPMGADHTSGNAFETNKTTNPLGKENQVVNSWNLQIRAALLDSMGVCIFIRPAFVRNKQLLVDLFKAKFGWDLTYPEIRQMGAEILMQERAFNEKAGVSERFRHLPEFMREEPLPPNNSVFDISQEELESIATQPINMDTF